MSFGDQAAALKMRGIIQKLVQAEIERMRPDLRVGRVYSIDNINNKAKILFAGATVDDLVTVRYADNMVPTMTMDQTFATDGYDADADVVRIAGSSNNLFITDFVSGGPTGSGGGGGGTGATTVDFSFASAVSTWTCAHNLGRSVVDVTTVDTTGVQIYGDVTFPNNNTVQISWYAPQSGTAIVRP